MNQPWPQQPQQQPFPGAAPQQPQQWQPQQQAPQQPQQWQPPQQPQPGAPLPTAQVAAGAQANAFAQMLAAPARQRRNREKPADGTHVIQFNRDTRMETSQTTFQPYLLVSYTVIESTVPQMVNRTFQTVMMMAQRASVEALAEMAKVVFGQQAVVQMSQQQVAPIQIAQLLAQHLCNAQTGQGLFALLNTWRSRKGKNGGPPPSYEDAFVNHDWLMAAPQQFSLAQAQAAGHQVKMTQQAPPTIPGQWGPGPVAPAQQPFAPQAAPQAQPWAAPQPQPQQQWAPPAAPQAPAPMQPPAAFPPPANVQAPPASPAPPAAFFPSPQGFPPVQR